MTDNIIPFPNPDEYKEEGKGEVMARVTVYEDGSTSAWINYDVETPDQKTWLKACLMSGMYAAHTIIHQHDEVEDGPIKEKDYEDLD